jgi:ABC-type polysaccharide/polyol phosphate transport system ATPase subunit
MRALLDSNRIAPCPIDSKNHQSFRHQLSINLYSVSKVIGQKRFQRTIARDVTWTIEPRSKHIILGHQRVTLTAFVNVIAGLSLPSEGWIKRVGRIALPGGFLRYSRAGTLPELIKLLAPLYRFDAEEVIDFVATVIRYDRLLRTSLNQLPRALKRELNLALTFAIPCDYYFFNGMPEGGRPEFRRFCQQALAQRFEEAAMLIGTSSERAARLLGPDASAAILYRGDFTLYQNLDDALAIFRRLEPESPIPNEATEDEIYEEDPDFIL